MPRTAALRDGASAALGQRGRRLPRMTFPPTLTPTLPLSPPSIIGPLRTPPSLLARVPGRALLVTHTEATHLLRVRARVRVRARAKARVRVRVRVRVR